MTPPVFNYSALPRLNSAGRIAALIEQTVFAQQTPFLAEVFSPLLPDDWPWQHLSDFDRATAKREAPRFRTVTVRLAEFRHELTATAGVLAPWLDASDEEVREVALRYAKLRLPGQQKWAWSQRRLGASIPGKTPESRWARINDARFWRRAIRVRLLREREHFYLRLKLIGRGRETYVSDRQLQTRSRQLRQQVEWMKNTVLVPRYLECGERAGGPLTLAQVASTPKMRFAKLYAFTRAMDEIAQAEGLESGMLTLTLEPEWHPNPSHGNGSWNGKSPREAHRQMAAHWQSILRDLNNMGIGVSGLRVVEPHKDACPHWHIWLLYRPEHETQIMATVMKYFPNKLKVRAPCRKGQKSHPGDRMHETRADLVGGAGRPLTHEKEGAQVEFFRIDRSISSGASYVMKYLLKTVDAGEQLNAEVGLFGEAPTAEMKKQREKHQETAKRVDAYRSLWGINAGQLFGVAKCLSAWDELRRLGTPPANAQLHHLWVLARGSNKPGRIPKNAGLRGNPRAFLEALGGLAACGKADKDTARQSIERLTVEATNGYGEAIRRPKGISLVERRQETVRKGQVDKSTGEIYQRSGKRSVKSVVASVVTRLTDWVLAPKKTHGFAVRMAQERAHQRDEVSSPAGLGKQARSAFWSAMATAWASLYPAERFPAVTSAEPPAPAKSWPALLASWGIAPQNPVIA